MKRIFTIVSILALVLASCGNNADDKQSDEMQSADLCFYRLHGPVYRVTYADTGLQYEFDKDGNLTLFNGYNPFEVEGARDTDSLGNVYETHAFLRNDEGRIIQIKGANTENNYTWENGLVVADEGQGDGMKWKCSYEHDANGNAIYEYDVYTDVLGKQLSRGTTTYTILNTDEHGNWIERSVKYVPDHATANDRESEPYNQKRKIEYYQ